jgi:hypothetical protein
MTQVRRVVLCELAQPSSGVPTSVRAYVALRDRGSDHLDVLVRSPSGEWLRTWAPLSQFKRFRVKALRPGHPLYRDERVCDRDPELLAGELAAAAQHARSVGSATETDD